MTEAEELAAAFAEVWSLLRDDAAMERYVMWEAVFLLEPQPRLMRKKAEAISSAITRFIKSSLPR